MADQMVHDELALSRERNVQLQHALDSRVAIEQAKGFIACAFDIDPEEAFDLLRSYARRNRVKLHAVCTAVVGRSLDCSSLVA